MLHLKTIHFVNTLLSRRCNLYNTDIDGDGVCDADELLGCTNPTASNYDPEATEVDGSCIYTGCLDSTACNYNPDAIEDDGNCDYSCCPGPGCCNDGTYWDDVHSNMSFRYNILFLAT